MLKLVNYCTFEQSVCCYVELYHSTGDVEADYLLTEFKQLNVLQSLVAMPQAHGLAFLPFVELYIG